MKKKNLLIIGWILICGSIFAQNDFLKELQNHKGNLIISGISKHLSTLQQSNNSLLLPQKLSSLKLVSSSMETNFLELLRTTETIPPLKTSKSGPFLRSLNLQQPLGLSNYNLLKSLGGSQIRNYSEVHIKKFSNDHSKQYKLFLYELREMTNVQKK